MAEVVARPPHPDDCRDELRGLAERRAAFLRERAAWPDALAECARVAVSAGLSITEIASLAGVSRETVYTAMDAARDC